MSDYIDSEYVEPEPIPQEEDEFADIPRLGSLVRHYRLRAGMTQAGLAAESGITESVLSLIENGKTANPWTSTLEKIANILAPQIPNASADHILTRLVEARDYRVTAYAILPGLVLLNDRLSTLDRKTIRIAVDTFNTILDALVKMRGY